MPLFFGPGGTAHMTITDWAKFISLHLRGDPANPHQHEALLTSDSFALLHRAAPDKDYQAGWYLGTRPWARGPRPGDTGRVIASQGDNGFWHTEAWVAPEIDFAVIVICNQGGTGSKPAALACNDAIGALMNDFLPKRHD
jgi:CubicO group peptidase (beta-lactamase class C family)